MGRPKQLLPISGRSLLRRAIDAVLAAKASPVVVVLGARADAIRPEVSGSPVTAVINQEWKKGLASSIRAGLKALESLSPPTEAVVLLLCDQPNLTSDAITRLAQAFACTGKSIVAASYEGHPGPPALFARRHYAELSALTGPVGARPLFRRHAASLATVELPELAVDLDTPTDYRRFVAHRHNRPPADH